MQQLLSQLGIDWHLLLSQAINFALLLIVLRIYVYKPLLTMLHERRAKIEDGLMKADEADRRLHEVDAMNKVKVKEAEAQALGILKKTETDAKELEVKLVAAAKVREEEAFKSAEARLKAQEEASRRESEQEAAQLVKRAIERTVELSPKAIDDALIARAVADVKSAA